MLKKLFFFCLIATFSFTFCAKPAPKAKEDTPFVLCDYDNTSLETRMQSPIFKNAVKVEVRSFHNYNVGFAHEEEMSEKAAKAYELKMKKEMYATFLESIFLNPKQIDSLSQIFFFKKNPYPSTYSAEQIQHIESDEMAAAACFEPRHAILFYDKNDKLFLRWNICFQCNNSETDASVFYKKALAEQMICNRQMYEINAFFKRTGIKKYMNPNRPQIE